MRHDPFALKSQRDDHFLDADELQSDVWHGGKDAGKGDGKLQRAIAVAAEHKVGASDVTSLMRDRPEPWKRNKEERINQNRVGNGEEAIGSNGVNEGRHRNNGVGGVKIAAYQKPADNRAESASPQPPFM